MKSVEEKTLGVTLKLSNDKLRELWNTFIEESAMYGEDSYIYDLTNDDDVKFLLEHMSNEELIASCLIAISENSHYIQWLSLNDGSIRAVKNIKDVIKAFWGDIFPRIMLFPRCYDFRAEFFVKGDGSTYFDDVFFPIIAEEVGYKIDGNRGTITMIESSTEVKPKFMV